MEKERLQKVIASLGYCSRRKAETLISEGKVKVDGQTIDQLGYKCYPNSQIEIDGQILNNNIEKFTYLKLYKPTGYVSTCFDPQNRKTIIDLLPKDIKLYSAGRLDYESSGLLIITNDGDFANLVTHPSSSLDKEYLVTCKHVSRGDEVTKLKEGLYVTRRGYKARPCVCKLIQDDKNNDTSTYSIILHEGKKRQIRDMMMTLSHPVISLCRIRIGPITLSRLKEGEYEEIPLDTIEMMREECLSNKKNNSLKKAD